MVAIDQVQLQYQPLCPQRMARLKQFANFNKFKSDPAGSEEGTESVCEGEKIPHS